MGNVAPPATALSTQSLLPHERRHFGDVALITAPLSTQRTWIAARRLPDSKRDSNRRWSQRASSLPSLNLLHLWFFFMQILAHQFNWISLLIAHQHYNKDQRRYTVNRSPWPLLSRTPSIKYSSTHFLPHRPVTPPFPIQVQRSKITSPHLILIAQSAVLLRASVPSLGARIQWVDDARLERVCNTRVKVTVHFLGG